MMTSFKVAVVCSLILAGCTSKNSDVVGDSRLPAQASEEPKIVYYTYSLDGNLSRDEISAARWLGRVDGIQGKGFKEGAREDYLAKFYSANTRGISLKGIRHAACFEGTAQEIQSTFFNKSEGDGKIRNLEGDYVSTKASSDGKMIGISFRHKSKGSYHFRMANCTFGKSGISERVTKISALTNVKAQEVTMKDLPSVKRQIAGAQGGNAVGFAIDDKVLNHPSSLPTFRLRADFETADKVSTDRPWQGMNLKDEKERIRFALILQKYFYEGMANQDAKNPDMNFIAANSKKRFWCHMPWMQPGISGREAVHGLTKELDLSPSKMYPAATPGSDWGVAYLNAPGCRTVQKVFGSITNPRSEPDFSNIEFEQGTVIVKILFTTANFPQIKDAFVWKANASDPGSVERSIKDLRHIQMDITIKDSSLQGANALLGYNVMTGYYYDPEYSYDKDIMPVLGEENVLKSIPGLPAAFFKMRPMGVQVGYDRPETGDTVIFPGALANGSGGRMNGPADNSKTSCLGCHGAAGTGARMVPGFLSMKMFSDYQNAPGLDFNQQLAVARDYYETTP